MFSIQSRLPLRVLLFVCFGPFVLSGGAYHQAHAQVTANYAIEGEPESEGLELLQSEPYDLVRFKKSAGGGWAKVMLLDFPGRKVPTKSSGTLAMSVFGLPGKTYEAKWADIESIELWEERLIREYESLIAKGDFSGAYPYLAILYRDNPGLARVAQMHREYLFNNAAAAYKNKDLLQTLSMLEELRNVDPGYRTEQVLTIIGGITDQLMTKLMAEGKLEDAQKMLARLERDYTPEQVASIRTWNQNFLKLAEAKRQEALDARDQGQWRVARRLALDSMYLYPGIPGGKELVREIDVQYPLVNVGVLQSASVLDPTSIDNWPSRRTGRLVYRALFEMRNAGSEGGEYQFLFGEAIQTPDRMQLLLELSPEKVSGPLSQVDSFVLADRLHALATRGQSTYQASWAAILDSLSVPGPRSMGVNLKRPHVLPQSLLQIKVDGSWAGLPEGTPTGVYTIAPEKSEPGIARFLIDPSIPNADGRPREVVEIQQNDAAAAVTSLLRGDLDALDHLFPADAARLRENSSIQVANYPLPTVHMLVPASDHPFLAERDFRRAICYGVNRKDILKGELLGNSDIPGCQVISGPFPAGVTLDDPLAYAYDKSIEPREYQPRLAALIKTMVDSRLKATAAKNKTDPPTLTPLKLGYPQDDLARVACQAISQQLNMVGIPVVLVELPTGVSRPARGECDLVYTIVALWEPITDARRVLGPDGLAASSDQLVGLGLRRLETARNWREVRERLFDLHHIAHHELPVIPLWQLVDSYAYRRELNGLGSNIVSLYQNLDRWRLTR